MRSGLVAWLLTAAAEAVVALLAAPAARDAAAAAPPSVLASYSFDDATATGPDTFAVWQGARHTKGGRGRVSLSEAFHLSGHRSVELRDVPGDGDFPELQGYFPARTSGRLYFHFAFLTSDPTQELNVALAGPRFFQLEKDGLSFWLGTREGWLVHYSDGAPRKLFVPQAFTWYTVDVAYDVASGTYDLAVRAEGQEEPLVSLRAPAQHDPAPGLGDRQVLVRGRAVQRPLERRLLRRRRRDRDRRGRGPAAIRGSRPPQALRRRIRRVPAILLRTKPQCLPPLDPQDLGFTPEDLAEVQAGGPLRRGRRSCSPDAPPPCRRRRSAEARRGGASSTRRATGAGAARRWSRATRRRRSPSSSAPRRTRPRRPSTGSPKHSPSSR